MVHERRARRHRSSGAARARSWLSCPARAADGAASMDGRRPLVRCAACLSAHGRRDLHNLHLLGRLGYAYGHGGPVYYILCYATLAYVMSYFMLPPIWRYARDHGLYSQADFSAGKYESRWLGALVSLVGIVALVPYLVLQFKGLGIIVEAAGYGAIGATPAVWIGAAVATAYVMVSGVRGSAWAAVAKDVTILLVVVFLGIYFPLHYY